MRHRWALLVATPWLATASLPAQGPPAGDGTIVVGSYSGHLTFVDEASGKFAKVPLVTGPPFVVRLSPDRTRFYVQSANQEKFEVVDVHGRKSLDSFTLSDARRHVRPMAFEVDPQHKTMVLVAKTATKHIDRWEVSAPEFIVYDLAAHQVIRTVPWPLEAEPSYYTMALRFSPDGKLLYLFADGITIFDAASMAKVDTWDLSLPTDATYGRFDAGPIDDSADPRGFVTGLFTTKDAVMKRKTLAIGRIDLAKKTVDVRPLGPTPVADVVNFTVAPDRRHANVPAGRDRPPSAVDHRPRGRRGHPPGRGAVAYPDADADELERPALPLRGGPDDRGVFRRRVHAAADHRARLRHDVRDVRHHSRRDDCPLSLPFRHEPG